MKSLAFLAGIAGLAVAVGTASAQDYPTIKLRQNSITPPTAFVAQLDIWLADQIKERSKGKIQIEQLWAGAGGAANEMLKLVGGGALDMGAFPGSYFPADMPFLAAPSALPLVMPTAAKADAVVHALFEKFPEYQAEAKRNKVWPVVFRPLGEYHLLCTSPIRSLEDLKNKKIRSQGEYIPLAVKAIGAVPVTVLPGEFYEAMQRGTVDCMLLPWDLLVVNRLYEVAKYGSTISFGTVIADALYFNLDKWNSFPDNVKKLFNDVAKDQRAYAMKLGAEIEAKSLQTMKEKGVEIIAFPDQKKMEAMLPDFFALWEEKMKAAGKGEQAAGAVKLWKSML